MFSGTNLRDSVLKRLVLFYYQGLLNFVLKEEEISVMNWSLQQKFLDATILNPLILKYPLNKNFSRLYLKKFIGYLEPHQDVHDELYSKLCSLMDDTTEEDLFHYRHYVVCNDFNNIISIRETNNLVVNGTTGMRTWEAGVMIADWALCNEKLFKNKKVLELGSGVGFTGITISKFCRVKEFMFTDCHSDVLKTLIYNISINFPNINSEEKNGKTIFQTKSCDIGIMPLDWTCIEDLPELTPDLIIGADVVYDPCIIEPLCNVIQMFLKKNSNLEIYFASIIRVEETFKLFLLALEVRGFKYEIIQHRSNYHLLWDETIKSVLLKIY